MNRSTTLVTQNIIILSFLVVTVSGFLLAVFGIRVPFVPTVLTNFSYQTMAPYQGFTTYHTEILAEGKTANGSWQRIDLTPYVAGASGERIVRMQMNSFRKHGDDALITAYKKRAQQILTIEVRQGKPYKAVRISREQWPLSPAGYNFLHLPAFTDRLHIATYP